MDKFSTRDLIRFDQDGSQRRDEASDECDISDAYGRPVRAPTLEVLAYAPLGLTQDAGRDASRRRPGNARHCEVIYWPFAPRPMPDGHALICDRREADTRNKANRTEQGEEE